MNGEAQIVEKILPQKQESVKKPDRSVDKREIDPLKDPSKRKIIDAIEKKGNPDITFQEIAKLEPHLRIDTSDTARALIADLRDPQKVGKDAYGDGLVNTHHKGAKTAGDHEQAQTKAYEGLQQKIDVGLVAPGTIGAEMCIKLGVSSELGEAPATYEGIVPSVTRELNTFLEKGNINQQEYESIVGEMQEYAELYGKAYGPENVARAYEVVRDNARKLTYQNAVDKDVFSGSDHGTRHIIDGNTRFAKQMITSLRANGVNVSAKDEVLIHQTMIDHDLGYTTGAAQAPKGFEASKDHPLVSAKFVEENKDYYVTKFGQDGYQAIHESVLNHSYPRLEYQSDSTDAVHQGLIRGITSTVDSLGVTVETKTPEFFWNKDAMRTLLKIRLAMETMNGKVPPDLMEQYKQELKGVAGQEQNPDRRAGYENAIGNFFNEVTADNTLGHYTGIVRNVSVEEAPEDAKTDSTEEHIHAEGEGHDHGDLAHKKLRVVVEMTPTEVYALLGNMFGDKLSSQSFVKVIKDLGLDPAKLEAHSREIREARAKGKTKEGIEVASDKARVIVGNEFLEEQAPEKISDILDAKKIQAITEVFHEVELLSIRTNINELLDQMTEKGSAVLPEVQAQFEQFISAKTTVNELRELNELFINLSDSSPTGKKEADGSDITVSKTARKSLKGFITQREKEFLGV